MKAVLISIKPKWCELIASGKKTVEVRKTKPKLKTPFKCYIYCTRKKDNYGTFKQWARSGKVIGEFICDEIFDITPHDDGFGVNQYLFGYEYGKGEHCLPPTELRNYLGAKGGFAWHISDIKIYDKPKELSEFVSFVCNDKCKYKETKYTLIDGKRYYYCTLEHCKCETRARWWGKRECSGYVPDKIGEPLKKPPQSWCYVEEFK